MQVSFLENESDGAVSECRLYHDSGLRCGLVAAKDRNDCDSDLLAIVICVHVYPVMRVLCRRKHKWTCQ